jgi:hypothetical protein
MAQHGRVENVATGRAKRPEVVDLKEGSFPRTALEVRCAKDVRRVWGWCLLTTGPAVRAYGRDPQCRLKRPLSLVLTV